MTQDQSKPQKLEIIKKLKRQINDTNALILYNKTKINITDRDRNMFWNRKKKEL